MSLPVISDPEEQITDITFTEEGTFVITLTAAFGAIVLTATRTVVVDEP